MQVRAIAEIWRMVRALLSWTIFSPVLLALLLSGGCVLPVGPEFQDPPAEIQQPPYFLSPPGGTDGSPFYEQTVTLSGTTPQQFVAVVADANLNDTLTVRWVANYPPATKASHLIADVNVVRGGNPSGNSMQSLACDAFAGGADPNLVVIVSDQGFVPEKDIAQNPVTARSQTPFNFDSMVRPVSTMTGWRIAGCLN